MLFISLKFQKNKLSIDRYVTANRIELYERSKE